MTAQLVPEGVDLNARNEEGLTALFVACYAENFAVIEALLSKGADVNATTEDGWTPLMAAAMKGNVDITRKLIEFGAEARCFNNESECTAFMYAAQVGAVEVVRLLAPLSELNAQSKEGWSALMLASQNNHQSVILALLDEFSGVIINTSDARGFIALHYAAQEDHVEVARILIARGADANAVDKNGVSALHMVALLNYPEMAKILVQAGGNVNARNATGATPLKIALLAGNQEIVEHLLLNGAKEEE
jgi:uncharacterized protein